MAKEGIAAAAAAAGAVDQQQREDEEEDVDMNDSRNGEEDEDEDEEEEEDGSGDDDGDDDDEAEDDDDDGDEDDEEEEDEEEEDGEAADENTEEDAHGGKAQEAVDGSQVPSTQCGGDSIATSRPKRAAAMKPKAREPEPEPEPETKKRKGRSKKAMMKAKAALAKANKAKRSQKRARQSSGEKPAAGPTAAGGDGSEAPEVYCICRQPDSGVMIECENCQEWFHTKCINAKIKDVKELGSEPFHCPACCELLGKEYPWAKRGAKPGVSKARHRLKAPKSASADGTAGGLPLDENAILAEMEAVKRQIALVEQQLLLDEAFKQTEEEETKAAPAAARPPRPARADGEGDDGEDNDDDNDFYAEWTPPAHCVPICADVREFDFSALAAEQQKLTGQLFDVICMDPPWQLASSNPTRGVAIGYQQLADQLIRQLPIPTLQTDGLIFIWVINAKYRFALALLEHWGYALVNEVVWVKSTVNRRMAKSHGYYLQHAKETCLVGIKGKGPSKLRANTGSDVIFSERRGQSQKPEEIYEMIEALVPDGYYLEIFGRRNNLRDYWVTIGNEL